MVDDESLTIFCDAVQTLGVHNGVVRLSLLRLSADGKPKPAGELMIPAPQLATLIKALQQVRT